MEVSVSSYRPKIIKLIHVYVTVGFIGYLPAPGSFASLFTFSLAYFLPHWSVTLGLAVLLFFSGVLTTRIAEQAIFETKDSRHIVIDEVVGSLIVCLCLSEEVVLRIMGFVLFRVFDILKPFPIGLVERLPHGWGVMSDDILAGLYSCICVFLI